MVQVFWTRPSFFFLFLRGIPNGKERIKVALRIRPTFLALYRRCFHRRRERYRGGIKLQLKQLKFNRSFATRIMINRSDSWQHSSRESMWRKKEWSQSSPSRAQVDLKIDVENVRCRCAFCLDCIDCIVSGRRTSHLVPCCWKRRGMELRGRRVTQRYYRLLATPFAAWRIW